MAEICSVVIGDPPALWADLGFVVDGLAVHVSGVCHLLGGASPGITAWSVRGLPPGVQSLDGLAFDAPAAEPRPTADHPNGVVGLDHLVVATPDLGRTIGSLEEAGVECRRLRDAGTPAMPMRQAFFRFGPVVVEVVGPPEPSGGGPPRLVGLAYTVRDLAETARLLGARLRPVKDAVQPGRRIATLDTAAGSSVPLAFMSGETGPQRAE